MASAPSTPKPPIPGDQPGEAAVPRAGLRNRLSLIGAVVGSVALGVAVSAWMSRGATVSATAGPPVLNSAGAATENPLAGTYAVWQVGDPVAVGAEPIVARPAGSEVPYVVIVRVALVGRQDDSRWESKVNARLERLRDAVTSELMETPFAEMQTRGYKASLASQLKVRFAKIPGLDSVQEVLIPMFAVQ